MKNRHFECQVYRSPKDKFWDVRDSGVLIYWPHGFGDWVFLSSILPLMEPSNRYFVTRFGDHYTAVFDGCALATPLYLGHNKTRCGEGSDYGNPHFGLRSSGVGFRALELPLALHAKCVEHGISAIMDLPFFETYGNRPFPFHTKARNMLGSVVGPGRLEHMNLTQRLPSSLEWCAPAQIRALVEARLRTWGGIEAGRKLCVVVRQGFTATGKNWGHRWRDELPEGSRREGEECRDFMRLLRRKDPAWSFVTLEERTFSGSDTVRDPELGCVSYHELFGAADDGHSLPLGWVLKALLEFADLVVGVPTGPYHLAMAKPGLPTVGLWIEHWPAWYDEPKAESIHLISRNVRDMGALMRPGSFSKMEGIEFQTRILNTRTIPGEAVLAGVEELLGLGSARLAHPSEPSLARVREQGNPGRRSSRFIAVTIACGETYEFMAKFSAEACRRHTGLETHILGVEALQRHGFELASYLKVRLFDEFPDAETILYFDADAIFLQAFDPAEYEGRKEWIGVGDHWDRSWIVEDSARIGIPPREYFNAGFYIANRTHHAGLFREAESIWAGKPVTTLYEQPWLNAARARLNVPLQFLPKENNFLTFDAQARFPDRVVLAHFNGLPCRPLEIVRRVCQYWTRTPAAGDLGLYERAGQIVGTRFTYERVGHDVRPMQFLADGRIGDGSAGCERRWELTMTDGEEVLWIAGDAHPTCGLVRDKDGIWCGRWLRAEQMAVRVTPILPTNGDRA